MFSSGFLGKRCVHENMTYFAPLLPFRHTIWRIRAIRAFEDCASCIFEADGTDWDWESSAAIFFLC